MNVAFYMTDVLEKVINDFSYALRPRQMAAICSLHFQNHFPEWKLLYFDFFGHISS